MATDFQAQWTAVKTAFIKSAREVPPEISMLLSHGRDFGPALKSFDHAATFEKRMTCMPAVLRAKTEYETKIQAALKKTTSKIGQKAQEALLKQIDKIWLEVEQAQFSGLTSKLETRADELSGKGERITKGLTGLPDRMLATEQINLNRRMDRTVTKLFEEIGDLHRRTKQCANFAAAALKAVNKLKAEDSWLGTTETAGGVGTKGVAIYALANFCLACADNGKQLISLLPV